MRVAYAKDLRDNKEYIDLVAGDIINMPFKGVQVEIGDNDTMRGLINGTPDPKGWMPIPEAAAKELAFRKVYGGEK